MQSEGKACQSDGGFCQNFLAFDELEDGEDKSNEHHQHGSSI